MTAAETTTDVFTAQARRVADDIDHETTMAGTDPEWLAEIARAATVAVDLLAAARRRAETAMHQAREQARR